MAAGAALGGESASRLGPVGSVGTAASVNASADRVMAQAQHGSAPDIAGQGTANPTGMILSGAMLLDWLAARRGDASLAAAARLIENAVTSVIATGVMTRDLGGTASTREFTDAVREATGT